PQLRYRWGPAAIFANDLLLLDEGDRRRRRSHLGHNRTAQNRAWPPYAGFGSGAKDAALLRCNCRGDWSDGCRCEFLLAHKNQMIVNGRSEEHTSELQSRFDLVCRLLLEKKK